ncbi:uncharacterized protein L969DRAFT_85139 [Mixia osmundae IAM 14324]|uniref:uncharacterized protein n=1 Tax=Mixia osmundae (strain CBS 9802 / IAM 14324 / JCM 22182 / KY 12970) TaxID=764103 RepID=UPI0004A5541F|nr:uncharacterized protein L969DRAFT_85139 [Mixia osmundae IAM 14324]KEI41361.1 hypothetical protein L969DRAFT_85139 [Mixia osmundae IAM 14324]
MPRENNRKRGNRGAKKQKQISTAADDAAQQVEPAPLDVFTPGFLNIRPAPAAAPTASGWPELDHDTRAYFKQIEETIVELEDLQSSGYRRDAQEGDEDELDERKLLLASSLDNLNGKEIQLATDPECSIILERLLYSMQDWSRRVLADRFIGQYAALAKDRFASHVLQTLFSLGDQVIQRELSGRIAQRPSSSSAADESAEELPTMTSMLITACQEIAQNLPDLLFDTHGTHLVRSALLLLSGITSSSAPQERTPGSYGQHGRKMRSKKSERWLSNKAPHRAFVDSADDAQDSKGKGIRRSSPELEAALDALLDRFESLVRTPTNASAKVRELAVNDLACIAFQILLEVEHARGKTGERASWADRLLNDAISETDEKRLSGDDFLETLLRSQPASPLLETLLFVVPAPVFDAMWSSIFSDRFVKLAHHPVANFVTAKAVNRVNEQQWLEAVTALSESADSAIDGVKKMIENSRTGTLKALIDRAIRLTCDASLLVKTLLAGLEIDAESTTYLLPCCLSLSPLRIYRRHPAYQDPNVKLEATVQGALLLQSWLQLKPADHEPVISALMTVAMPQLIRFAMDPISSRVLDVLLTSPAVLPKSRREFLKRLLGQYQALADDRIGSRVADQCWASADVYLKEKIAISLIPHHQTLQSSHFGHYFVRKVEVPLYQRRPSEWRNKMIQKVPGWTPASGTNGAAGALKRKEAPQDEIDVLFSEATTAMPRSHKKLKEVSGALLPVLQPGELGT